MQTVNAGAHLVKCIGKASRSIIFFSKNRRKRISLSSSWIIEAGLDVQKTPADVDGSGPG